MEINHRALMFTSLIGRTDVSRIKSFAEAKAIVRKAKILAALASGDNVQANEWPKSEASKQKAKAAPRKR